MKKSQGEIFGVALLFVIIIVGFLIYVQISALDPQRDEDLQAQGEYEILAEGSLNSIIDMSTGCYIERGRDSVRDLMSYCVEYSFSGSDPIFTCESPVGTIQSCTKSKEILNETLFEIFNTTVLGPIPYELRISIPDNDRSQFHDVTITNFGNFSDRSGVVTFDNYLSKGYRRAPSGLKTWSTSSGDLRVELYLYYR